VGRAFVIGGAGLYADTLALPPTAAASVNRILLTRVLEPSFEECDVYMPAFEHQGGWQRASHAELIEWVGHEVPEGAQNEDGVKYEFQMWVKSGDA
jgi:dihydrofolate reductase